VPELCSDPCPLHEKWLITPAFTLNNTPIAKTGCTWLADKLASIAKDLAGGRAEVFE